MGLLKLAMVKGLSSVSLIAIAALVILGVAIGGYALYTSGTHGGQTNESSTASSSASGTTSATTSFTNSATGTTPVSQVTVEGTVIASGLGTVPQKIVFVGSHSSFTASLTGTQYSVTVPNLSTYKVLVSWNGSFPWQTGIVEFSGFGVNVPAGSDTLTYNFQASTPNSVVGVSGHVSLTGNQTSATLLVFQLTGGGQQQYIAHTNGGNYSVQLPNLATYSVTVSWVGAFSWQHGNDSSNSVTVNLPAATTGQFSNFQVSTPDSWIRVSGHATASTSCASLGSLAFATNGQKYQTSVNGGMYSLWLPNQAQFAETAAWSGSYPWQSGTLNGTLYVNQAIGSHSRTADLAFSTPNCLITVTGAIQLMAGETPNLITFSFNGQVFTAVPSGGSYSIQLPNMGTYLVAISWTSYSTSGTCHPTNSLSLNEPPGTSAKTGIDWSC